MHFYMGLETQRSAPLLVVLQVTVEGLKLSFFAHFQPSDDWSMLCSSLLNEAISSGWTDGEYSLEVHTLH